MAFGIDGNDVITQTPGRRNARRCGQCSTVAFQADAVRTGRPPCPPQARCQGLDPAHDG